MSQKASQSKNTLLDSLDEKNKQVLLTLRKKVPSEITSPMCKPFLKELIKNNKRIYQKYGTLLRPNSGLKIVD